MAIIVGRKTDEKCRRRRVFIARLNKKKFVHGDFHSVGIVITFIWKEVSIDPSHQHQTEEKRTNHQLSIVDDVPHVDRANVLTMTKSIYFFFSDVHRVSDYNINLKEKWRTEVYLIKTSNDSTDRRRVVISTYGIAWTLKST